MYLVPRNRLLHAYDACILQRCDLSPSCVTVIHGQKRLIGSKLLKFVLETGALS